MKKVLPLFFGVLLAIVITGCLVKGIFNPSHLGINSDPAISLGAKSLMGSYSKLFSEKYLCRDNGNGNLFYSVDSTMPSGQFVPGNPYSGKLTSYVAMFSVLYNPDYFRTIWDCADGSFTYYGACPPKNLQWPYPCTYQYSDDVFLSEFVPVSDFQKQNPDTLWAGDRKPKGVSITTIKKIVGAYLEDKNGFINKNYPLLFSNKKSALGIVCELELNNGELLPCYLLNNDLTRRTDTAGTSHVLWKN